MGITYKDGVLLASDTLGERSTPQHTRYEPGASLACCSCWATCDASYFFSWSLPLLRCLASPLAPRPHTGAYGSTKRYKSFERLYKVNDACVVGAGGELSDFQYIMRCAVARLAANEVVPATLELRRAALCPLAPIVCS